MYYQIYYTPQALHFISFPQLSKSDMHMKFGSIQKTNDLHSCHKNEVDEMVV